MKIEPPTGGLYFCYFWITIVDYTFFLEAGTNPASNDELSKVLEECRIANMPKETINRQFERAKSRPMEIHYFDVKGPAGTFFIIETLTENINRTRGNLEKCIRKLGG